MRLEEELSTEEVVKYIAPTLATLPYGQTQDKEILQGAIAVTDKRVVIVHKLHGAFKTITFDIAMVERVRSHSNTFQVGRIALDTNVGPVEFTASYKKEVIASISRELQETASAAKSSPGNAEPRRDDLLAQIARLAELHSSGILTDAEFSAKKTELLSRL